MLNRRALIAASVAVSAGIGHTAVQARGPIVTQQGPSFYRYKIGTIEVTVVNDGLSHMPIVEGFVENASTEAVNAALAASFMEPGYYAGPYNPIVVSTGTKLVVIDTGTGEAAYAATQGLNGRFLMNLGFAGIDPASVDCVILSHYHGDHINGLLRADGTPTFPNAEILAPAKEHSFWTDEGEQSRASKPRILEGFRNVRRVMSGEILRRLRTYEWGQEVVPGVTSIATPGHTPGHSSHRLSSGSQQVFVQGDVTHAPFLFARHPDWHIMLDVDGAQAEATRRQIYEMLVADRMPVQGFHYPFPALAHVERSGVGYREVLAPWRPILQAVV